MILENHIRGRRRVLDEAKKARLCELVALESYTVESAAESLDVSLRTVQRERRSDQDFDHELRLALQQTPDPRKLMEQAARTHWRAAAWLLERTKPEEFARKPVNMTSLKLVATAFRYIQEAALAAVPAECREALYRQTQAAIEKSTDCCFPMRGPWGDPRVKRLPFETPLADVEWRKGWGDEVGGVLHDRDDQGNVLTPPADPTEVAARQAREAALAAKRVELRWRLAERFRVPTLDEQSAEGVLSPEIAETTKSDATKQPEAANSPSAGYLEFVVATVERTIDDECPEVWRDTDELEHPDAQEPRVRLQLLSERLHRHRRRERRAQRAAEKKAKAARKRAAYSRRAA
ncbi:hypothetical protein [Lacipirellula sp.]|uniref:hypothetical protein n=1 Tax=Lacipirellula sp. TaxID=2691419 RepID=UPI003D09FCAD